MTETSSSTKFIESYLKNLHNPLNDSLRFIIFLGVPFLSIIFFFQITEKKIINNIKNFFILNYNSIKIENQILNKYFFIFFIILIFEFFSLDFENYNYFSDIFHEGLWLSASQNSNLNNEFWLSSYVVVY